MTSRRAKPTLICYVILFRTDRLTWRISAADKSAVSTKNAYLRTWFVVGLHAIKSFNNLRHIVPEPRKIGRKRDNLKDKEVTVEEELYSRRLITELPIITRSPVLVGYWTYFMFTIGIPINATENDQPTDTITIWYRGFTMHGPTRFRTSFKRCWKLLKLRSLMSH